MKKSMIAIAVATLVGCGGGGGGSATVAPMSPAPTATLNGHVVVLSTVDSANYITIPASSLAGKSKITMKYRIEAGAGVRIFPRNFPDAKALLTLHFQRAGDNWTAKGEYETYRWYAKFATHTDLKPGTYTITAPLAGNWTAVLTSSRTNNPTAFNAALADAGAIGFVLGGGDGLGHGVYATGPARIIVDSFNVE